MNILNSEYLSVLTTRWGMRGRIQEPSLLAVYDAIPGVCVFVEGDTATRSSKKKYTVVNPILQQKYPLIIHVFCFL